MPAATKACDQCSGAGTMPRERRTLADGITPDPLDFRRRELCGKCGGDGRVREDYSSVPTRSPGHAAIGDGEDFTP